MQTSITVRAGDCKELEIRSVPTVREGTLMYEVPLSGGVSVWLQDPISIPEGLPTHYNWDLEVDTLIAVAEVRHVIFSSCPLF